MAETITIGSFADPDRGRAASMNAETWRPAPAAYARVSQLEARLTELVRIACVLVPMMMALSFAGNQGDTAHDGAVVRVLGLRGSGPFGFLEALFTAPFLWIPLGTRAYRAAISSAVGSGVVGFLIFELAKRAAARAVPTRALGEPMVRRALTMAAALASLTATLNAPMMLEASIAGGCTWTVVLALLPGYLLFREPSLQRSPKGVAVGSGTAALVTFITALAFTCDPVAGLYGAAIALGSGALALRWNLVPPLLLGLLPLGICWLQAGDITLTVFHDGTLSPAHTLRAFLSLELGAFALAVAAASTFFLARSAHGRNYCYRTLPALAIPLLAIAKGAQSGPTHYAGSALLLHALFAMLVAPSAMVVVLGTANLPIPFARATAVLLSILFFAVPLRVLDDATLRAHARGDASTLAWERFAVASLPKDSLYLTSDERVWLRLRAARITGSLRDDLEVLPFRALSAKAAPTILREDPHLGALLRDFLLTGEPSENALSKVAAERPVVLDYDSAWNPLLTKHLVPVGAFLKFEPEPRGASERRLALEKQAPERARLARSIMPDKEPELILLLTRQMERRALALGITGERESVSHAIDDLRAFAPKDPLIGDLVHRIVIARGAVDTKDIAAPF